MNRIVIEIIPHETHRYETCGDFWNEQDGTLQIRVSKLSSWQRERLIIIHELIEETLCRDAGIDERDIDSFDISFEKARPEGNTDEPGDDSHAPYKFQHGVASGIERILAAAMEIDWKSYSDELNKLP
jgi:hypothetical protein